MLFYGTPDLLAMLEGSADQNNKEFLYRVITGVSN